MPEFINQCFKKPQKMNTDLKSNVTADAGIEQSPMLPAVVWVEIGADDFSAMSECKRYNLRIEDMGFFWWWSVDILGTEIGGSAFTDEISRSKKQAMALAEKCYYAHLYNSR